MKRIAHIDGTTIVNVSLAADDAPLAPNTMLESDALAAGYTYKVTDKTSAIVVSMRSFREACGRDLVIKINAYVASIPDAYERFSVQNDLEYALTVARDHPKVAQVAAAIGKTESEIDEVFALAQYLDSK
jgi:hypothetical protein